MTADIDLLQRTKTMKIIFKNKNGYGGYLYADNIIIKTDIIELRTIANKTQHILIRNEFKKITIINEEGKEINLYGNK